MVTAPVMGKNSIKNQNKDRKIVSNFILICGSTTTDIKYRSCRESVFL